MSNANDGDKVNTMKLPQRLKPIDKICVALQFGRHGGLVLLRHYREE